MVYPSDGMSITASRAGRRLARKTHGTVIEDRLLSEAARKLGLSQARKSGRQAMSERGSKGAHAYWNQFSAKERSIELRRRAAVRKARKMAKLQARLEEYRKGMMDDAG